MNASANIVELILSELKSRGYTILPPTKETTVDQGGEL
jgi:hypothetical protein